jgi:glycosyltransferase involved in cell wall biosynthesis
MRILQIVKTVDGAQWAVDQVTELVRHGLEMHVVLPRLEGRFIDDWRQSGAHIHQLAIDLPLRTPWRFQRMCSSIRGLVSEIAPDIIHSHFFSTTLAVRYALGGDHPIPRLFQVPGPFHLEHRFFKSWELSSAGPSDYWIASSKFTLELYRNAGIPDQQLFLSYYGNRHHPLPASAAGLRAQYGISSNQFVIGNINYMYPPRLYLGQTKGIKRHEDVIDALAQVVAQRDDVVGLIIGGQWGGGDGYERRLKARAAKAGRGRIIMTGRLPAAQAKSAWVDFDVAVHVPTSENCGGVIEPLMAGVPVIAARTGGLPEVILDGMTGTLVESRNPSQLAQKINSVLADLPGHKAMAEQGKKLVSHMFDVKRTAAEIASIYAYLLDPSQSGPAQFNSNSYVQSEQNP